MCFDSSCMTTYIHDMTNIHDKYRISNKLVFNKKNKKSTMVHKWTRENNQEICQKSFYLSTCCLLEFGPTNDAGFEI